MKYSNSSYGKRLLRAIRVLEKNLDFPPSLEELSRVACFSPFHFHRIFTAVVGEGVSAYRRRCLIQRAAKRLSYGRESITRIASDAGYTSTDAFSRAFRNQYGISPSTYRRQGGGAAISRDALAGETLFYTRIQGVYAMEVRITKYPATPTLCVRHIGAYNECAGAWSLLCQRMAEQQLTDKNSKALSICYDDPDTTPLEKCRMDVCMTLPHGMGPTSPAVQAALKDNALNIITIGGEETEYAAVMVKGSYSLLHPMYRSLYAEWLPASGREPANFPGFEIYHNCPESTPEDDLLTEIFIPLQPRR